MLGLAKGVRMAGSRRLQAITSCLGQYSLRSLSVLKRLPEWILVSTTFLGLCFLLYSNLFLEPGFVDDPDIGIAIEAQWEAQSGHPFSAWEDLTFPGMPRNPTRATLTHIVIALLARLTGDISFAMNLVAFGSQFLAFLCSYLLVRELTESRLAAFAASLFFPLSRVLLLGMVYQALGGALLPLVARQILRFLGQPSGSRSLSLAICLALFIWTTTMPLAFIGTVLLFLLASVYWLLAFRRLSGQARLLTVGFSLLAAGVTVLLLLYYLWTFNETGLAETAVPGLERVRLLATRMFGAFIVRDPPANIVFSLRPLIIQPLVIALVVSAALLGLAFRPSRTNIAFGVVILASIFFTVAPHDPFQTPWVWLSRVPFFRSFEALRRPMLLTLLAYAALWGALMDRVFAWARARGGHLAARMAAILLGGILLLYLVASAPYRISLAQKFLPSPEFVSIHRWVGEQSGEFAFLGLPFLPSRYQAPWAKSRLGDESIILGTAISHRSAVSQGRVGFWPRHGETMQPLVDLLMTEQLLLLKERQDFLLHDEQVRLVSASERHESLLVHLQFTISEVERQGGTLALDLRTAPNAAGKSTIRYRVALLPGQDALSVSIHRPKQVSLSYGPFPISIPPGQRGEMTVLLYNNCIWVEINGYLIDRIPAPSSLSQGTVTLQSRFTRAEIHRYEVYQVERGSLLDARNLFTFFSPHYLIQPGGAKLLALFNARYVIKNGYAPEREGIIISHTEGLNKVLKVGDSEVFENQYAFPKVVVPNEVLLVGGDMLPVIESLVRLEGFRFDRHLLLDIGALDMLDLENPGDLTQTLLVSPHGLTEAEMKEVPMLVASMERVLYIIAPDEAEVGVSLLQQEAQTTLTIPFRAIAGGDFRLALLAWTDATEAELKVNGQSLALEIQEGRQNDLTLQGNGINFRRTWLISQPFRLDTRDCSLRVFISGALQRLDAILIGQSGGVMGADLFTFDPTPSPSGEVLSYTKESPTRYVLRMRVERPSFLVFMETWDPKWRASSDGQTFAHLVAYHYANAFYTPRSGVHTVTIEYGGQSTSALLLKGTTALWVLALMTLGGLALYHRRVQRSPLRFPEGESSYECSLQADLLQLPVHRFPKPRETEMRIPGLAGHCMTLGRGFLVLAVVLFLGSTTAAYMMGNTTLADRIATVVYFSIAAGTLLAAVSYLWGHPSPGDQRLASQRGVDHSQ